MECVYLVILYWQWVHYLIGEIEAVNNFPFVLYVDINEMNRLIKVDNFKWIERGWPYNYKIYFN